MIGLYSFDRHGLEVDAVAVFTAAASPDWYRDSVKGGTQTLDEGELGLGPGQTVIGQVRWLGESQRRIVLLDNDQPTPLSLSEFFGPSNTVSPWTLYIQTDDGIVSSNQLQTTGTSVARFDFTTADLPVLNGVSAGTKVLMAVARPAPLIARAGIDQTKKAGDRVVLNGSASTADTQIASYEWRQVTGEVVPLIEPMEPLAYFIAPELDQDTQLSFRLRVRNTEGETAEHFTTVTVLGSTPFALRPVGQYLAALQHLDLLLEQYDDSTNLRAFIQGMIDIGQNNIIAVLEKTQRGLNPDEASGILLDWIGQRLNLDRPYVSSSDAEYFGFAGTQASGGRTWGQAPFFTIRAQIEDVVPVGDATYRKLLKARARRLRGGVNRETIEAVLGLLFGNGSLDESDATDLVLRVEVDVTDTVLFGLVAGRLLEAVIPRPLGRTLRLAKTT